MSRVSRPSPSQSAAATPVGTIMKGNDGFNYKVVTTLRGVHRWLRTIPLPEEPPPSVAKFKKGDRVKIVNSGLGCHPDLKGQIVTIDKCIEQNPVIGWEYTIERQHLYLTKNGRHAGTSDTIGEKSFELLADYSALDIEKIIKQQKVKNMSTTQQPKARLLTKRAAQEVRTIETSLINKEEVFKMLALAEATGLPCLLVGNPGVSTK